MRILVGLGNPGPEYTRTRHNMGFRVLDAFAERHGLVFGSVVDTCATAAGRIAGRDVVLIKPLFYMNRSGESLLRWMRRREQDVETDDVVESVPLVVCDDIALPLGAARLRARGGSGGHRGLDSLVAALETEDFPRLRLGVAGGEGSVPPEDWADYVLGEFSASEWPLTQDLVAYGCDVLDCELADGIEAAASRFNRKPQAPDEE